MKFTISDSMNGSNGNMSFTMNDNKNDGMNEINHIR